MKANVMAWEKLSSEELAIIRNNAGLSHYLESLLEAQPATPRSWLYESRPADDVLEEWISKLNEICKTVPYGDMINQFDLKQREKFGPQGGHPPLMEALEKSKFYEMFPSELVGEEFNFRSLTEIIRLPKRGILPRTYETVVDDMRTRDTLSTNSGWPLFTKRKAVAHDMIDRADREKLEPIGDPAIILFRTYNGKIRMVWMYPMASNLNEFLTSQPLQQAIARHTQYVTPWKGFEDVKERFTELWAKHKYAFGGDTTQMDAHMGTNQIRTVMKMCDLCFGTRAAAKLFRVWLREINHIDIVVSPTHKVTGVHGVASGSGWTQLSETIFQIGVFDSFIRENNLPLSVEDGMGIGDDYVWFFDEKPDSQKIVDFWQKFGLPGKPEKQSNDDDCCTFLQRLFIKGVMSRENPQVLAGIYPTIRALNSLINPEKFHDPKLWNSDMFCIRVYQILENCVDHPAFEEFVKFVVRGQKDLIPFSKKSARELRAIQRHARANLPGLVPTYNQEKRDRPLSVYSSIRIAKSL